MTSTQILVLVIGVALSCFTVGFVMGWSVGDENRDD